MEVILHQRTHVTHSWSECCRAVRPLRALLLLDQYRQKSRLFRSSVLLVTLGDDFRYTDVREWDAQFTNYQKLFDYFNQHPELHIKVNTLRHVGGGGACVGGVKISHHSHYTEVTVMTAVSERQFFFSCLFPGSFRDSVRLLWSFSSASECNWDDSADTSWRLLHVCWPWRSLLEWIFHLQTVL